MLKIGPTKDAYAGIARTWDEKDRNGIAQIFISHGDKIHSLQLQFVENGTLVLSKKHGSLGYTYAPNFSAVKLNYPSELITGISGYSGIRERDRVVTSIIFTTNKSTYGPFGCRAGDDTAFDYQIGGHNKFGGFHGTASNEIVSTQQSALRLSA
ncbi:hypothetical protein Vadar_009969 [Vaccinium darrowii]|uniref:Uncharacterized protein n=1 Tax=Vaccinium darrowii TaxID=229202 RepID=A0ACB7XQL9_9ERIC|nr:hypothetical protein Vadar_009969 [Vaccinium darrowii]